MILLNETSFVKWAYLNPIQVHLCLIQKLVLNKYFQLLISVVFVEFIL